MTNLPEEDYRNPVPVVVCLVPVTTQLAGASSVRLLGIIRGVPPALGEIALPGGYVDELEDLKVAASRELQEETGLGLAPADWLLHTARTSPRNRLQIFVVHRHALDERALEACQVDGVEVRGIVLIDTATRLGLPLHQEVARFYLDNRRSGNMLTTVSDMPPAAQMA